MRSPKPLAIATDVRVPLCAHMRACRARATVNTGARGQGRPKKTVAGEEDQVKVCACPEGLKPKRSLYTQIKPEVA
jgi:hypothetical protein